MLMIANMILNIFYIFNVPIKMKQDVKIEKVGAGTFMVRVTCEKGGDNLVAILKAFDEMCLNVQQARVSLLRIKLIVADQVDP